MDALSDRFEDFVADFERQVLKVLPSEMAHYIAEKVTREMLADKDWLRSIGVGC